MEPLTLAHISVPLQALMRSRLRPNDALARTRYSSNVDESAWTIRGFPPVGESVKIVKLALQESSLRRQSAMVLYSDSTEANLNSSGRCVSSALA